MRNTNMALCRVCCTHENPLVPLSSTFEPENAPLITFMEAFERCTSLCVDSINEPQMPESICFGCSNELKLAYAFLCKCIETDEKLRSLNEEDSEQFLNDLLGETPSSNTYQAAGDLYEFNNGCDLDKKNSNCKVDEVKAFMFPKGDLECDLCGNGYFTTDGLQQHSRIHMESKTPEEHPSKTKRRQIACECQLCGKILSSSYRWKMHMKLHTGQRDFLCDFCPKTFTSLHKLRYHIRSHTGERPYRCPQCDKRFSTTTTLNAHIRTHTADKSFSCNYCDKRFKQMSTLQTHIKINHMTGTLTCVVCHRNFTRCTDLHIHMRSHTGEKPYQCAHCNREYVTQANLNWHMKKAHSPKHFDDCSSTITHELK